MSRSLLEILSELVDWYDERLEGSTPSLITLSLVVERLRTQERPTDEKLAADIDQLLNPNISDDPRKSVEAVERIRGLLAVIEWPPEPGELRFPN